MRACDISVGTSGWKFDDWAGNFYPLRVPQNQWLEYYAARFPVGEINSTYYRIAPARTYAAIERKTPSGFRFIAKVHSEVTHRRQDPVASMRELLTALEPLRGTGKLIGVLAQFPASFGYSADTLNYVLGVRNECRDVPLCLEFRNGTWLDDEALNAIRAAQITWVCPDEPDLPGLMPHRLLTTADLFYARLHGRNARTWYNSRGGDRYDYNYSEEELTTFGRNLLALESPVHRGVVFFNNCYAGQAPRNAWWLKSWLEAASSGQQKLPENGFDLSTD
jgi:uncharacterized protein YecE (DUF72 family)